MTRNDIINDYMDNYLLNGVYPEESVGKIWSRNGTCIFMYMELYHKLYVKLSVWDELCDMFSLTGDETNSLFRAWAIKNLGLPQNTLIMANGNFI